MAICTLTAPLVQRQYSSHEIFAEKFAGRHGVEVDAARYSVVRGDHELGGVVGERVELKSRVMEVEVPSADCHMLVHRPLRERMLVENISPRNGLVFLSLRHLRLKLDAMFPLRVADFPSRGEYIHALDRLRNTNQMGQAQRQI